MQILSEKGAIFDLLDVLRRERDEFGADKVHIFGSRARGAFRPGESDVDIASDSKAIVRRGDDWELVQGKRSGLIFDIHRAWIVGPDQLISFLDDTAPHRTIILRRRA